MDTKRSQLTEEELKLIEETERFMEEVYSDPEVANAPLPEGMRENIFREIRAKEEERERQKEALLSDEEKEYIRLGKRAKSHQRLHKYYVLAAALILAFAFGITSIGGPQKLFEKVSWMIADREQTNVDSDDERVKEIKDIGVEEIYQKIEEEFGFYPVRVNELPKEVEFLEGNVFGDTNSAHILYGIGEEVCVSYNARANYQTSSWGKDIEDELIEEYTLDIEDVVIGMKKYMVDDGTERVMATFEYQEVSYSLTFSGLEKDEIHQVLTKLYFP